MKINIKKHCISLVSGMLLLLPGNAALAQSNQANPRVTDTNLNAWYQYFGDHYIAKKWSVHTEIQFRRHAAQIAEPWSKPQQLLTRFAVNYDLSDKLLLTAGYAFVNTHPYGAYPSGSVFPENRIYEQVFIKDKSGRIEFQHRFRQEQRFIKFPGSENYDLLHRTRYQFRLQAPLVGKTIDDSEPYLAVYDEIFIGFGKQVQYNVFDQNRLGAAMGFRFTKNLKLEAGYMNQIVAQRRIRSFPDGSTGQVFENNHTFVLGLFYNLDFRDKEPEAIEK